jgi:three-Cys-motif partner protein
MAFLKEFENLEDDGLITPEIGLWGQKKYRLVSHYSHLFSKSMKNKWDSIVYIDLFSGSGRSKIRRTNRIIASSPIMALKNEHKFDRYIFCEKDPEKYDALKCRIESEFPEIDTQVILGDSNECIDDILEKLPSYSRNHKVLSFCFVDPFKIGNLKFKTIEQLSKLYVDFLVLIPSGMDANRNLKQYLRPNNKTVDDFLGNELWRETWENLPHPKKTFEEFIVDQFNESMSGLRYINPGMEHCCAIRSDEKNLLLYRLTLYSRNKLGKKFWKETKKYSDPQRQLFE